MSALSSNVKGIGLGLRQPIADALLERLPKEISWVEVHPENYVERGGRFPHVLGRAREHWPVVTHGLTLGLGSVSPFEREYVQTLKKFLHEVETPWHSEHLCVTGVDDVMFHDLIPIPLTRAAARIAIQRLRELRDAVEKPIALENITFYAEPGKSGMDEASFVLDVLDGADALLLLDVNNIYVNAKNFGFDPRAYLDRIPKERVAQIHIAGHLIQPDGLRIDTHGEAICEDVFSLLEYTLARLGEVPVLLERDGNYPSLDVLVEELRRLTEIYERATSVKVL
ncbi:MAG: DUF692 domain-containing protein [Sandaracinaceae bacterium]|nr:DUF692 domain-containing protein [Sandaracinaceae bacterium]